MKYPFKPFVSILLTTPFVLHAEISTDSIQSQLPDSLQFTELNEITVAGKRPDAIIRADRISYLPSSLISGNRSNLYEALQAIPGISIGSDDSVKSNGVQSLAIRIDGRKSMLNGNELLAYLRSLPVSDIEKIDIVSFGGAKSEGSDPIMVLDIKRRRKTDEGYRLGVNIDGQAGKARQFYGSLSGEYSRKYHTMRLTYSHYSAHNPTELLTDRPYLDFAERLTQEYSRLRNDNIRHLSLDYDLKPTSNLAIGSSFNYNFFKSREQAEMITSIPLMENATITTNNALFVTHSVYGGAYVRRDLSSRQGNWLVACDLFSHRTCESQLMEDNTGSRVDGDLSGKTYGIVGTADWTLSLSPNWSLSSGFRSSYVSMNSGGQYITSNIYDTEMSADISESLGSDFGYNENVNAIYAEGKATFESINAGIGLRAEQSNLSNKFSGNESAGAADISRHYFHVYPSVSITISPSGAASWMIFYANRVKRPDFMDLDPFINLFDDITHIGGNINLKEAISHSLNLAWTDNRRFRISLSGETISGDIVKCYRELTDRIVYVTPENLPNHLQAVLSIAGSDLRISRWWSASSAVNLVYSSYKFPEQMHLDPNRAFTPMLEISSRLSLSSTTHADIKAAYQGTSAYGQARVSPKWNTQMDVNKTFLGGRLAVSVYMKDIFNSNHQTSTILLNGRKASLCEKEYEDMRKIGVSVSYNFSGGTRTEQKSSRNSWFDELNRVNL